VRRGCGCIRRWLRRIIVVALAIAAVVITAVLVILATLLAPALPDPTPGFNDRKGRLAEARITASWREGDSVVREIYLISSSGLRVELTVREPAGARSPRPLVILLGGRRTGRDATLLLEDVQGVVLAGLSYPYRGDPDAKLSALLLDLPEMQRALIDTPPAVLLALDYLLEQPFVDPERVELVGVSFGAFVVSVPGAIDERIRRVWLIHGAGEPVAVLEHVLEHEIPFGPARRAVARLLAVLSCSHHLRPERWVGQIAPRPVVVVNSSEDETFPRSSIEALHKALGESSEIIWMPGGHANPRRTEIIQMIGAVVLARLMTEPDENETDSPSPRAQARFGVPVTGNPDRSVR
jgi:dienelactone hydrolase